MTFTLDPSITVLHFDTLPSTNDYAMALPDSAGKTLIYADTQTKGKGRLGRSFYSPEKTGLYMSFLFFPNISIEKSIYITPAVAVSAARAIEKLSGKETQIKWVNDILLNHKKVCGILTEAQTKNGLLSRVVVGAGFNLFPPKNGFPADITSKAGTIFSEEIPEIREKLIASFLEDFSRFLIAPETCLPEYQSRLAFLHTAVTVRGRAATTQGIDDRCRLLVRYENGEEEALDSGEVSVQGLY